MTFPRLRRHPARRWALGALLAVAVASLVLSPSTFLTPGAVPTSRFAPSEAGAVATPVPTPGASGAPLPRPVNSTTWQTLYTLYTSNGTLRPGNELPPSGIDQPWYTAYDPTTNTLYLSAACTVYTIDPSQFRIEGTLTAANGCGVIYLPSTGDLYLSSTSSIAIVNPLNDTLVGRIPASQAGQTTYGLFVYDPRANAIVVGNAFNGSANVVNLTAGRVTNNLTIGYNTVEGAYNPVTSELYLAGYESNQVEVFNSTTWNETLVPLNVGIFPTSVTVNTETGNYYVITGCPGCGGYYLQERYGSNNSGVNHVGIGSYPSGAAFDAAANLLYVTDSLADDVYEVNATNLSTVATIGLQVHGLGVYGAWWPEFVPQLSMLYVPTSWEDSVVGVSVPNGTVVGSVGGFSEPDAVAWDPACGCFAVGDYNGALYLVNGTDDRVVRTVDLGGAVRGLTYDNTTGMLWASLGGITGTIGVDILDGNNGTVVSALGAGEFPTTPAYDPDNHRMYVPADLDNKVDVYNATSGHLDQTLAVPNATYAAWDPVNDRVYVTTWNGDEVTVLAGRNGTILGNITHDPTPAEITYDPATGNLYTADQANGYVSVVDPTTGVVTANLSVGGPPNALLAMPGNDTLALTDGTSNVTLLNLSSGLATTVAAGSSTDGLALLPQGGLAVPDLGGTVYFLSNRSETTLTTPTLTVTPSYTAVGSPVSIVTSVVGGSPPLTYSYSGLPAGCVSENQTNLTCTPSVTGTFFVTVEVTDTSGASWNTSAYLWVAAAYDVTFNSVGLGPGVEWWVNLSSGVSYSTTQSNLTFDSVNGTFSYTVGVGSSEWLVGAGGTGAFTVAGASTAESVSFVPLLAITFTASGLPPGTTWEVSIAGGPAHSTNTSAVSVAELAGTYPYVAEVPSGGFGAVYGSVTVTSAAVNVSIQFAAFDYTVTFTESGLPTGTAWWLNLTSGSSHRSTTGSIVVSLPNGTDEFFAQSAAMEWQNLAGFVTVEGADLSVALTFVLRTYTLTVSAAGLPQGAPFWVNVTGDVNLSSPTGAPVTASLPNGTYTFTASAGPAWNNTTGRATVTGSNATATVTFAPAESATLTFLAPELESGGSWWVNVSGVEHGPTTVPSISLLPGVGIFSYQVGGPANQLPINRSGTVSVQYTTVAVVIEFPRPLEISAFTAIPSTLTVNSSVDLNASVTGGVPPLTYAYTGLPTGCASLDTDRFTCQPSTTGEFTVTVRVVGADGSVTSRSTEVTVSPIVGGVHANGSASIPIWVLAVIAVAVVAAVIGMLALRRRRPPSDSGTAPGHPPVRAERAGSLGSPAPRRPWSRGR